MALAAETAASGAPLVAWSVACPVCGATGGKDRYVLREMLFGTREEFAYWHCGACGVLWLAEPPADMAPYYPPSYHDGAARPTAPPRRSGLARWLHDEAAARRLFGGHRLGAAIARRIGTRIDRDVKLARDLVATLELRSFDDPILDVGCGPAPDGLAMFGRVGFHNLLGIDPMLESDGIHEGIPIQRRTMEEVASELGERFALVTFHHSFEHVPDPRATLAAAAAAVRSGGSVVIRTPVMGTWFWEEFGTSWWELDPPRHLFVHTQTSLEHLAREAGLRLEHVEYESSPIEIVASDQIARDIPWRDSRSWWAHQGDRESRRFADASVELVRRLNAEGRAGRAIFRFRKGAAA